METEAHYISPDHPRIGPLIVRNSFPYSLAAGDWMHLRINEWRTSYQAQKSCTFESLEVTLRHIKEHPDEWTGDVFPIIVLITGGIDVDLR